MKKYVLLFVYLASPLSLFGQESVLGEAVKNTIRATTPVQQKGKKASRWWPRRHKEKLAEKEQLGDVQLVFLGDSITHSWDKYQDALY